MASYFFCQCVDSATLRISNHVPIFMKRGFRVVVTQLPPHQGEWSTFFQ